MKRRLRGYAPTLLGSPIPQRSNGDANRSALITMTYFHPWTLRAQDSTPHVPYIGSLRPTDLSWEESMSHWLDGNLLSLESSRYVSNFLSVYRMRPMDEDDKANSDNECEDHELLLNPEDVKHALNTTTGG